jgi:WD40 repeat protein
VLILDRAGTMIAERRGGWCSSVAWSPDGTRLASGVGRSVVVLDAAGTEIFSGERASTVTAVAWVNRRVASAAYGGVHLHHASRTAPRDQMPFTGSLLALSVSPDRKWIATGNQDATLHVWRLGRSGDELSMSGYPRKISALAFSPDSTMLASGGGSDVTVWDFTGRGPRGSTPRVLCGHEEAVVAVAWASRGGLVAGAASDGSVAVWHPARARPGRPEPAIDSMRRDSPAAALCWDGLGRLLVGWSDSTVVARSINGAG